MNDLTTVWYAAALFQKDPRLIDAGLRAIGITTPEITLNGKSHYKMCDIIDGIEAAEKLKETSDNE